MKIEFDLNGQPTELEVPSSTTLLAALRDQLAVFGVKHGCETGECGACTALVDGIPVNTCVMLAAQVDGKDLQTIESVGEYPDHGWRRTGGLDPIQQAFIETGAIQCGYCTPGLILAAQSMLAVTPDPSDDEIREGLSGNLCRCTGYTKVFDAVRDAARTLRDEAGQT